jgi:hypothetical protein
VCPESKVKFKVLSINENFRFVEGRVSLAKPGQSYEKK